MAKSPSTHNTVKKLPSAVSVTRPAIPHFRVDSSHPLETNYTMGELLGEGSFGRVFKVTENQTGKVFACKQVFKNKVIVLDYI